MIPDSNVQQTMLARDLFLEKDIGKVNGEVGGWMNPYGVLMVRLSKAKE